ncbi:toll/interleukin-1 receptor domain-containing protein [Listeria monocytogenes]|nr:toll/interleukin-1 receptor domain-containing protein [Listeria monocytogenes]
MIFLSHNYQDKPVVEQLAIRLKDTFGQENVFYDSWSIQPGDGLIDKMNEGLEKCRFFFFFVSKNSLASNMVKMEWQNAVMKASRDDVKIIPIRLDSSIMPAILLQTMYLDLFTNGLETTLRQVVDIVEGNNTFRSSSIQFSNLTAKIIQNDKNLDITITANHYMEPKTHFIFLLANKENDIDVSPKSVSMCIKNFYADVELTNGVKGNGWYIGVSEPTLPGFPFDVILSPLKDNTVELLNILHEVSQGNYESIPIEFS